MKPIRVLVLYRVIQHWRAPVFRKLSKVDSIDLKIFYGPDFKGSKVISTEDLDGLNVSRLSSFQIRMNATNGNVSMPVSYFLFFKLIFNNPSIIISEGASNLVNALQGFIYAKIFGKKFVWWSLGKLRNNKQDRKRRRIDFLIRYIESHSDGILTYSSVGKEYFSSLGINEKKIFVAVNVIDTESKDELIKRYKNSNAHHVTSGKFRILYVGAVTREKKLDMLLEAYRKLEARFLDVELNIVGDGPERKALENLSSKLGLRNVVFHGEVISGAHEFFLNSDVFVLPGLGGLAISEAMVYGLPVIVSVGDGCEVDLVDDSNGFRNSDLDSAMLYSYLERMYEDRGMTESMKIRSKYKIENYYNISSYINNIKRCIDYVYSS